MRFIATSDMDENETLQAGCFFHNELLDLPLVYVIDNIYLRQLATVCPLQIFIYI